MEDIVVTIAPKTDVQNADNAQPAGQDTTTVTPLTDPAAPAAPAEPAQPATPAQPEQATPAQPAAPAAPAAPEQPAPDEGLQKVIDAYKGGKLKEYLEISGRDYRGMSDEDVFKQDLRKANPGVPERVINKMLVDRLAKYDFGDDEEAIADGEKYRKLEADKIRDVFEAEQKAFSLPAAPSADPQATSEQIQAQQKEVKALSDYLETHPVLQAFETSPVLKVGESGEFAYKVDPAILNKKSLLFPEKMLDQMFWSTDDKGSKTFDMEGYIATRNYALNRKAFEKALIEYGKSIGSKAEFDGRHNPRTELTAAAPAGSQTRNVNVRIE